MFVNLGYILLPLVGALVCLRRAPHAPRLERRGWFFFAAGFLGWTLGGIHWAYEEIVLQKTPAFPSLAVIGFVSFTLLAALGLYSLSSKWAPKPRSHDLLDIAFIGTALSFATYNIVMEEALQRLPAHHLQTLAIVAFPAVDTIALALAAFIVTRAPVGQRVQPAIVTAGLVLIAVLDIWWIHQTALGSYVSGTPVDLLWHVAFMVIVSGIMLVPRPPLRDRVPLPPPATVAVPLALAVLLGLLLVLELRDGIDQVEIGMLAILIVISAVRQALAIRNNDELRAAMESKADELASANAKLEQAAALRQRFLNATAHELGNPLTPLSIHAQMLMKPSYASSPEKVQQSAQTIITGIDRLQGLVQDLLTLARVESGRFEATTRPLALTNELARIVELYSPLAKQKEVSIVLEAEGPERVQADPGRLGQILGNYLTNAIKYTPSGSSIHVSAETRDDVVRLNVRDQGPGLTPAQASQLFRPFSQVQEAVHQQPGTGLGLYVCKTLAEGMGGQVGCESPGPGSGTTFWIELPKAS